MSQSTSTRVNRLQNREDFTLEPLKEQAPLFKFKYLERILNPPQDNPEDTRTCTIKCLVRGCK
jgi:hypothetical protein